MQITDYSTHFDVHIDFNQWFKRNLAEVKGLPEKRWIHEEKVWRIPAYLAGEVHELALRCKARMVSAAAMADEVIGDIGPMPDLDIELPIKANLRPYQRQGIARALQLKRLIIGDEQGLGKTLQSISTIVGGGKETLPCLVICPATVKENWKREIEQFSNLRAMILTDAVRSTWEQYWKVGMIDVFITNYESLKKFFVLSMPAKSNLKKSADIKMKPAVDLFKAVIIDESHRCKDPSTLQTKLALRVCHGKEWVMLLTGTPVKNKPIELYPQLAIMGRLVDFGGRKAYVDRYCQGGRGAGNLKELNYLLNERCFFRREKRDVAKDLPDKQRQKIICEISTREEYGTAFANFKMFLRNSGLTKGEIDRKMRAEALVQMNVLRQISARGKLAEVREFAQEVLDAGEKLILFCNLKEIVRSLKEMFPDAVTITGSDSTEARQQHIDSFQNDPKCQLIICNIQAAGVGITLTASSRVAFVEYPWTYADAVQCEDRAHRIGQKNNVMCTYFLGQNTIDEKLFDIIMEKMGIHAQITGASDQMEMNTVDKVLNLFSELV